ncbi:MAG: Ig-like domain-containing protein [Clostridiales bacterium]|nr:MAG: Ig-like domain-containing protein [Clostridiales bacterium]
MQAEKNFMVRFGAIIQLVSKGNGKYVIQRMTDGKFVTENQTEFTFSDLTSGLAFTVKDKTTVDAFYVKNGELTLIYGDMEYVENSSTKAGNLGFTFNKSADGDISMDNVTLSDGALKIPDPDPDEPVNDITKFEFTNISTDIFADEGETLNLPVTAEATSGIEKIEVYIDGEIYETLTDAPYVITLQNIDRGSVTVTAKAVSNSKSESEISANVNFSSVNNAYTVFEDSDFADGEGNVLKSGISMYSRRGTVKKRHGRPRPRHKPFCRRGHSRHKLYFGGYSVYRHTAQKHVGQGEYRL